MLRLVVLGLCAVSAVALTVSPTVGPRAGAHVTRGHVCLQETETADGEVSAIDKMMDMRQGKEPKEKKEKKKRTNTKKASYVERLKGPSQAFKGRAAAQAKREAKAAAEAEAAAKAAAAEAAEAAAAEAAAAEAAAAEEPAE